MAKTQPDPRNLVFTSAELAANHVRLAEKIQTEPGVTWNLPAIDRAVIPMRGGDVTLICARPGMGKTTIMAYLAREEAKRIRARGTTKTETVLYATWEGTVDAIYAAIVAAQGGYSSTDYYWGRVNIETVKRNMVKHGAMPIMMIGFSTIPRGRAPVMTLDVLLKAIESVKEDFGMQPTLVCLDYLQLIPRPGSSSRVEQVSEAIIGAKMLGMQIDVPFVLGAQASREVDNYGIKLPAMSDVQWSSQAEQHADKIFGLWRPALTEELDASGQPPLVKIAGHNYPATPDLLVMRMLKQRGDNGRHDWAVHLEPQLLNLAEKEEKNVSAY